MLQSIAYVVLTSPAFLTSRRLTTRLNSRRHGRTNP